MSDLDAFEQMCWELATSESLAEADRLYRLAFTMYGKLDDPFGGMAGPLLDRAITVASDRMLGKP